jgi:NAD(P)-dependent dehydrogenase (short-subunit alcohol dehydrogenase family)
MKLDGRVALITGGGSGIGAACARHMAGEGAAIAVTGMPTGRVPQVAVDLRSDGHQAIGVPTDVRQEEQLEAAVAETVESFGRLDIVVASAAIQQHDKDHTLHELDVEVWDETHNVNSRGVFLTCKHGLRQMMAQGDGGNIVIIASVAALGGGSANVSYLTGKHGLLGLNRHIGIHYAEHGIRCNALCSGALERTPNHDIHPDPEGRARRLAEDVPMGRPGTPEDIAPWVTFLCSDEAAYATGSYIVVDGGLKA